MNKTLAVLVHARRESTRVPDKHLRPLDSAGNCMLDIALKKVRDIKNVNETIRKTIKAKPIVPNKRSKISGLSR